ncbi:hypothetical protein [Paenibacillus sp. 8b26]|uniref:hypothetical protein n=1 Tax=Paenibacillus sp. 8b26 TaxID=3424133 RepID=UPI003D64E995
MDIDQDDFVVEKVIKISCGRLVKGMMLGIVLILILGGCQKVNTDEDAELIHKAKDTAVQYLKDKYKLNVEITYAKKFPTYVTSKVDINGNVIGHAEEDFTISVNYETQETSDFAIKSRIRKSPYRKWNLSEYKFIRQVINSWRRIL